MTQMTTKPKQKKTQAATDPHSYLSALSDRLGPRAELSEPELTILFGREIASRLPLWIENKIVDKFGGPIDPQTRRSVGWRYHLSSVVDAIRNSGEIFAETGTATALLGGEPAEAIDCDRGYSASEITMLFGIPTDKVDAAVSEKKLVNISPADIREPSIRGSDLLNWLDSDGIPATLSIHAAAVIARRRRFLTANPEPPEAQPTLVDFAFQAITKKEIAEQEQATKQRAGLLARYRAVIHRHDAPQDGDSEELADVCRALGYDRVHVDADIAALQKIVELSKYSGDEFFQASKREAEAVAVEKKELEKRHRDEQQELHRRESKARAALRNALESGSAINSIKTERRELFGC